MDPPPIRPVTLYIPLPRYPGTPGEKGEHMENKTRHPPFERCLTDEQIDEIIERYMEGGITMMQLADQYGVSKTTISKYISQSDAVARAERRADIRSRMALIKLKNKSADAADKLITLLDEKRGKNQVYADIQIIQQVLDRAGVREEKAEDKEVRISFADGVGIAPKMPKR